MSSRPLDIEQIHRLIAADRVSLPKADEYPEGFFSRPPTPASVLMPMFQEQGEWHLLYIRRSEQQHDRHSGQVAFPGGKVEPVDDNAIDTALRETREEIGLGRRHVTLLGSMNEYRTITNFLVKPVVAEIPWPVTLTLDEREVSRVFSIPLKWLAQSSHYDVRQRVIEGAASPLKVIRFEPYDGEVLWGVSARLTLNLLQILGLAEPAQHDA